MERRYGRQSPTWEKVGSYASSRGSEAVQVFEAYGRRYYGSQRYEMELFLARDDTGGFAGKTIGITKPRQNGKSFAARDYALWMAVVEKKSVLFSAHHGRTVRKMFKEMCDFVNAHKDFKDELVDIYKAGGYESIVFKDSVIDFQTRTASGGRGGTYQILIIDESQELTELEQEAILPTVSAAGEIDDGDGDPQKIYLGTVPGPGCKGTVFQEMHDRAHAGESSVWWLEWAAYGETIDDVDLSSVDLWYECNPAMGRRMSVATVRDEYDTMSREGFARERLGWWSKVRASGVIPSGKWAACATEVPPDDGVICFSVKFGTEGTVAVCAAIKPYGEPAIPHFELVHHEQMDVGTEWLEDWLVSAEPQAALIVIDGRGNAEDMRNRLLRRRVSDRKLKIPSTLEMTTATASLLSAVKDRNVTYYQDDDLDSAALECTKRKIGVGGFGFQSTQNGDAAVIEAAALAVWGLGMIKRDPRRKARGSW